MPTRLPFAPSLVLLSFFFPAHAAAQEVNSQVRILYTGRLFGYYYAQDAEDGGFTKCPASDVPDAFNPAAAAFLQDLSDLPHGSHVLVGTGDNFAPEIEARTFTHPPGDSKSGPYLPHEKELYSWNYISPRPDHKDDPRLGWIRNQDVPTTGRLYKEMLQGKSWIPADNVACFLRRAHYDAIVPGKHDFYFGAERLRLLARVLASPDDNSGDYTPVQMLGANIVIKTSWTKDHEPIPQQFSPTRLGKPFVAPEGPLKSVKLSISDGKSVYPWLQYVATDKNSTLPPNTSAYLFEITGKDPYLPDVRTCLNSKTCTKLYISDDQKHIWFDLPPDWRQGQHFSVLKPGQIYSLCLTKTDTNSDKYKKDENVEISCTWFPVYKPFFLHPSVSPIQPGICPECAAEDQNIPPVQCYTDPEPFVLKELRPSDGSLPRKETAVFGVVDPDMESHIGQWNSLWIDVHGKHLGAGSPDYNKNLRTIVSFEDPLEALREMMQYFDRKYCLDHSPSVTISMDAASANIFCRENSDTHFIGTKILLAQMAPPQAQSLSVYVNKQSTALGTFDAVISAADDDFATRDQFRLTSPFDLQNVPQAQSRSTDTSPAFLAVPPEAWPFAKRSTRPVSPLRSLQILNVSSQSAFVVGEAHQSVPQLPVLRGAASAYSKHSKLFMDSRSMDDAVQQKQRDFAVAWSSSPQLRALHPNCLNTPSQPSQSATQGDLNNFVMCAMQQKTEADIVLLQKRDVFWPALTDTPTHDSQVLLNAILWKGDFMVVLAVPGSTLQKILKESDDFNQQDDNNLSLESERGRGLLRLGIFKDENKNYVVNDVPLDPGKLYSVVTTDYIASGDTGYPELAGAVGASKPEPQYDKAPLQLVSAVVCRTIAPPAQCDPDALPKDYFDQLSGNAPADPRPGNTVPRQIRQWSALRSQGKNPVDAQPVLEKNVQNRHVWSLAFDKLNFGYGALYHSFSEANLNNFFSGVQATEVTAPRNINWSADEKLSLIHSYRYFDLFSSQDLNYVAKFTATTTGPSRVNQSANILDFDNGAYWHPWSDRHIPHWDLATILHVETQAFTTILPLNLTPAVAGGTKTRNFELGRTWTMLARTGPRYHNRHSYVEGGVEAGRDLNAIKDFQFVNNLGAPIGAPCFPTAKNPLQTCASNIPGLTTASGLQVFRENRAKTGVFWHSLLSIPFIPKVAESIENQGDFFFNNAGDNSTDTRFRHLLTDKLTFQVFSNLSFSPTYQVLFYENKVDDRWLWQQQAMITVDFSFDLTNFLVHKTQLEYKVPASK